MKGDNIADRLLDLAVACLRLAAEIETSTVGKHIARQVTRSSTSGGAQLRGGTIGRELRRLRAQDGRGRKGGGRDCLLAEGDQEGRHRHEDRSLPVDR